MGFSRQEYWSGLLFPSPGDLLDLGIELESLESPALREDSLPTEPPKPSITIVEEINIDGNPLYSDFTSFFH